jgi:Uncharacterized distant relative of cell wall-associated hydrolases
MVLAGYAVQAQNENIPKIELLEGDLLLQDLDCGPLCDAIESVTDGFDSHDFSHIGLVAFKEGTRDVYVIEAVGNNVRLTRMDSFMARTTNKVYIARVNPKYASLIPTAIKFAKMQLGKPYDDEFIYDNDKYYCSELIYDAFKSANGDKPFFKLEPMTFKSPNSKEYNPAWVKYYSELNMDIPQDKPGINPAGISRSDKLVILNR